MRLLEAKARSFSVLDIVGCLTTLQDQHCDLLHPYRLRYRFPGGALYRSVVIRGLFGVRMPTKDHLRPGVYV